jgi:eukaryotic-like serine/threonine-protein kinase
MPTARSPLKKAHQLAPDLPKKIGKYKVISRLGEGATSEVFLAHDEFHQRNVAIKRVRSSAINDPAEGRYFERFFAAEAALVGRLEHPNVVKIYDAVSDTAAPYLVMEHVGGNTLRHYCSPDQLLPLELIVELGFKCAMALGYMSRQGLIHRDIKPANLLTVHNSKGIVTDVKVTDFGSVLNTAAQITQVHRVGSLAYMSPEQLDGSNLDSRTDMYSLGAVLYHLVVGKPLFDGNSQAAMMNQIYHHQPTPPSQLRANVGMGMDAVILSAVAKKSQDRYDTWDDFAQALSQLIVTQEIPRGQRQHVLDSERFTLLRELDFFCQFGDVELWEVVHRAKWQRFEDGHALYTRGQEGGNFHILARGEVEVFRQGTRVAKLGSGTSVGEMTYLAPNPELRLHSADVLVSKPTTTICFTPESVAQLSVHCRHLFDQAFIRVLVRRLHAAHEALAHPRRIL